MHFISKSEEETKSFAEMVLTQIQPGDIIALEGDLGAGKTTFTKAMGSALGISDVLTSPTFVIMKNYAVDERNLPSNLRGLRELVHVDCYRFGSSEDAFSIGLDDFFQREDIITVIEWPEKIKEILPPRTKVIKFKYISENEREISASWLKK